VRVKEEAWTLWLSFRRLRNKRKPAEKTKWSRSIKFGLPGVERSPNERNEDASGERLVTEATLLD